MKLPKTTKIILTTLFVLCISLTLKVQNAFADICHTDADCPAMCDGNCPGTCVGVSDRIFYKPTFSLDTHL